MSTRTLLFAGSAVRIGYGLGALLSPRRMVEAEFAPDTHGKPEPRLLLRAFGGHQVVAAALTLASTRSLRMARGAALLSMLIDSFDVGSAVLEWRERGARDRAVSVGIVFSGAGIVTFATALRALSRQARR